MEETRLDLSVPTLGRATIPSPLHKNAMSKGLSVFIDDENRVRMDIKTKPEEVKKDLSFERAGPREKIFFNPETSKAAIVTCGGICPGLNDVIRGIVLELHHWYNVKHVYGVRYGYSGLAPDTPHPPITLSIESVANIHLEGGTILGSARGRPDIGDLVDTLINWNINMLFCVGGDGTLRGADEIAAEIQRRKLKIAVIGIPKTIDNDVPFVYRSFGFQTAVEEASKVLSCAHVEAKCARRGVGLVKLMGRDAGFVTAYAALASGEVNFCLIPEMKFPVFGPKGLLDYLRERLARRGHALIAISEGAGQHILGDSGERDASGNKVYNDVGRWLRMEIEKAFAEWGEEVNVKYISPSYVIRSVPANSEDSVFCAELARHAVHAAMAGKTSVMIGHWHGEATHVPLSAIHHMSKRVTQDSSLWLSVLENTGQPAEWWGE